MGGEGGRVRGHWGGRGLFLCFLLLAVTCSGVGAEIGGGPASQLERAKEFSGQVGPYLAVGLRMGEGALKRLGCEKHGGMTVRVECPSKRPYCLLVDGLQLSTGCTTGNRGLEWVASSRIRVVFISSKTGERVVYVLADEFGPLLEQWSKAWKNEEAVALLIYALPSESMLFKEVK